MSSSSQHSERKPGEGRRLLGIYLNDHLSGAVFAGELIKRALRENRGSTFAPFLEELLREVGEDRETLERLMDTLGVRRSGVKRALAVAAERAGRLKLNGLLAGYSPLSRLLELETLTLGVTGKRALWRVLREHDDARLRGFDFDELERRANEQLVELERHRLEASRIALRARS